jgi:hypothetical protein
MPTVVIDARDRTGADTTEVSLFADGAEVAHSVLGTEIDLDPGVHVLRFQARDGSSREQRVVLKVGERRRPIHVDFSTEGAPPAPVPSAVAPPLPVREPPPTSETPAPRTGARHSVAPWVFGSITAASAVGFGVFAGVGYADEKSLARGCASHCTPAQVTPVRTYYVLSDVALGVGVAAAAATALSLWLGHKDRQTASWHVELRTSSSGAGIGVDGRW